MTPKLVVLWTDAVMWLLLAGMLVYAVRVRGKANQYANQRAAWAKVARDPAALCGGMVLVLCLGVAMLDSIHFRRALAATVPAPAALPAAPESSVSAGAASSLPAPSSQAQAYSTRTESLLDVLMQRQIDMRETSYSAPLAAVAFTKDSAERDGQILRIQPRLAHAGAHLKDAATERAGDIAARTGLGLLAGLGVWAALALVVCAWHARTHHVPWPEGVRRVAGNQTAVPLRAALITLLVLAVLAGPAWALAGHYHLFGTDRTGNDVFYQAMKSLRTAFVIGTLATLATLPLAVGLGVVAGYFKGWVDEVIQYLYTTLSSVPNVLLIAACVLMMQVFIDQHPELFETGAERADLRLFLLCVILGLTGWATLCRLLRAETMKLRELDYVQAAVAFGAGPARIMWRHIVPNVMHLVIITTVLDFSALILYEAVLSYVGVGVDPSMNSFGGMINLARSEMSRDPVVWWSFAAAFGFMVAVVLAANLFADGVRDAFDPRARVFRPRRVSAPGRRPPPLEPAALNREAPASSSPA